MPKANLYFTVSKIDNKNHSIEFEDKVFSFFITISTKQQEIKKVTVTESYKALIEYIDGTEELLAILEDD